MNFKERCHLCRVWNKCSVAMKNIKDVADELGMDIKALQGTVEYLKANYPELHFPPLQKRKRRGLNPLQVEALNNMLNKGLK